MNPFVLILRIVCTLAAWAIASSAAAAPDDVLVRTPEIVITRADWEAELLRIPSEQRVAFVTSPQRVQLMLNNLLVNRTLAERARAKGVDKEPVTERRLVLEDERLLSALMVERIDIEAGLEFDRMSERNLARARELYLVNQAKYMIPERIDVTHILFESTKRGKEAAMAAAADARAKILSGADFAALALASSDDPSAKTNKGRLDGVTRGQTDPAFEKAAFALKNAGDVSEPVLSRFGYHVIRLEKRTPAQPRAFSEAQSQILADMRQKHVSDAREAIIGGIRGDSRIQVSQEAVDALVVKVDFPPLPTPPKADAPAQKAK